ncbi:MAG TPA: YicC/YloC family endoribonuclease [Chitinophagales bacterium]|nr:YicC/YloC family endoribonuclease [Chitinophagales bacterium]
MIQSMTGYGKAESIKQGRVIKAEVRSLNNRYFDLNLRTSSSLRDKEPEIRNLLNETLQRGKVDVFIAVENGEGEKASINKDLFRKYYAELKLLAKELDAGKKELLSLVMQMPEVMGSQKTEAEEENWEDVKETLLLAVKDLIQFRMREGKELEGAFAKHVDAILELMKQSEQFEPERREQIRSRLQTQLQELISKDGYDKNRFEQELIYYIERLDFTEEKVRLRSHCDFFLKTLDDKESNGRRLGFISQEMGREINTLGSKANHAEIQKFVVQMKDELEKIKEQLLNVL